ncbi:MAG: cupin domain-containing protein [Actinomycetota bacterium]
MIVERDALRFVARAGRESADPLAGPSTDPLFEAGVDFTVRIVRLSSETVRWAHRHPLSVELLHVCRGRGLLWEGGVERRFEQGDTALVPVGVPHATVPDPGTDMELICFFPHSDLDSNIEELEDMIVRTVRGRAENG